MAIKTKVRLIFNVNHSICAYKRVHKGIHPLFSINKRIPKCTNMNYTCNRPISIKQCNLTIQKKLYGK